MILQFNKRFYKIAAIRDAIDQFADFGRFKMLKKGKYYQVTATGIAKTEQARLPGEFANYVLMSTLGKP